MAKSAVEDAYEDINNIDKQKAGESQTIIQFLKENINLWKKGKNTTNNNIMGKEDNFFS